jgi:hypothetical protein
MSLRAANLPDSRWAYIPVLARFSLGHQRLSRVARAQVPAHHHHFAVMQAALATARVALEEKSVQVNDPEDALVVAVALHAAASNRVTRAVRGGEANRFAAQ